MSPGMEIKMDTKNVQEVKFRANSEHKADWINGKLHFWFRDGTNKVFNPSLVAPTNRTQAEFHGWEQRLGDSMAVEIDKFPNKSDRSAEKRRRLDALIEHYHSGAAEWNITRAAGGGSRFDAGLVLQAMMQHFACDLDAAEAKAGKLAEKREVDRDEALKLIAAIPAIAGIIATIRAARSAPKVDVKATLDELAGM
jgi:hypothetical protein